MNRLDEFWANVVEELQPRRAGISCCWVWIGPTGPFGYGMYKSVTSHRAAAALYCRQMPSKVYMRCNNPRCVRVDHLSITYMKDRKPKKSLITGRKIAIPTHRDAKLVERVLALRSVAHRSSMDRIAELAHCSRQTVKLILREAPIYDLLAEAMDIGELRQMRPHKRADDLSVLDRARYERLCMDNAFDSIKKTSIV